MSDIVVLGASAVVVVLLILIAAALGFRTRESLDATELHRLVALSEPGQAIEEAALADDGTAALARLTNGKLAVAKVMGDRVTLRLHAPDAVAVRLKPGIARASFADLGFPAVDMKLKDPPHWISELAAAGGERT